MAQALQHALEHSHAETQELQRQLADLSEERAALREALDDQGSVVTHLQVRASRRCCRALLSLRGMPLPGVQNFDEGHALP